MLTLVLSDTHLGNDSGYDIYAGGEALAALLDAHGTAPVRVIFNGDTVDFLMNTDPLELEVDRAVAQARAIVAGKDTARTFEALGRLLAAGGEAIIRLGNHDIELALPEVQEVFRQALGQPPEVSAGLSFELGDQPMMTDIGGASVLITHGDHCDAWNKVDYAHLPSAEGAAPSAPGPFTYAAGSRLVKTIMNPLKRDHRLRFADLLKPDFQGAVLTALAVAPEAVKEVFGAGTLRIMWQLFKDSRGGFAFDEGEDEQEDLGLGELMEVAELSPGERGRLKAFLDPNRMSFGGEDDGPPEGTRLKLAKAGLKLYAGFHRRMASGSGDAFFSFEPGEEEQAEARRLASKFEADVVLLGHTHAARWKEEEGLLYANTGTWIWLMRLPDDQAAPDEWAAFLEELDGNRALEGAAQQHARTERLLTFVTLEPADGGGARVSLCEWTPGQGSVPLRQTHIARR